LVVAHWPSFSLLSDPPTFFPLVSSSGSPSLTPVSFCSKVLFLVRKSNFFIFFAHRRPLRLVPLHPPFSPPLPTLAKQPLNLSSFLGERPPPLLAASFSGATPRSPSPAFLTLCWVPGQSVLPFSKTPVRIQFFLLSFRSQRPPPPYLT